MRLSSNICLIILGGLAWCGSGRAAVPTTARLSVSSSGVEGNHNSATPAISGNGRYVVFVSSSQSLIPNKSTTVNDIFLHDNQTGSTIRVSNAIGGVEPNGASSAPTISSDGRYIVFESSATNLVSGRGVGAYMYDTQTSVLTYLVNGQSPVISRDGSTIAFTSTLSTLVPNDTNNTTDVFVMDRATGQFERESVASDGSQSNNPSGVTGLGVSATGRYVVFESGATDLVVGDTNSREDIFMRDRQAQTTIRVSLASDATQGNQTSSGGSVSADGRRVVFESRASNLVPTDGNGAVDVFLRDTQANQTSLISVSSAGVQAALQSEAGVITPDGAFVTFDTADATLVSGDTNGVTDVFLRDLTNSTTSLISLSAANTVGNGVSDQAVASDDGRYVVFRSAASDLVAGDGNASTDVFMRGPLIDTPGALAFSTQPAGAAASANFAVQPVVEVRNPDGSVKWDYSGPVTLTIKAGTGRTGAVLSGPATLSAVHGIATFAGLSIDLAGTGYVLTAGAAGLASADSAPFAVAQVPTRLAFSTQPAGASAGLAFATQPAVQVLDVENNVVAGFTGAVTLALKPGSGRTGAVLSGLATINAVNGTASFTGLSIDLAGSGYVLSASNGTLAGADSAPFSVAQTPTRLAVTVQPDGAAAGLAFTTQPVVQVLDAESNLVPAFNGAVTMALKPGTGRAGAVLSGTLSVNAVGGVATFTNLSLNLAGTGYVLTAGSGALASADTAPFAVAQTATKLAFFAQPSGAAAGIAFTGQPAVQALDAENNVVTGYTRAVSLAIKAGTGRPGAILGGTTSISAVSGAATFTNLSVNLAGAGYVLTAASGTLAPADSSPFTVAQTPTKLVYALQPAGAGAGVAFSTQPIVVVKDAEDNLVATFSGSITVAIKAGTGRNGAILGGTTTATALNGVATFSDLSIDLAGSGYVLTATSANLASADSAAFTVAQTPTKLVFSVEPNAAQRSTPFLTQPAVQVLDAENHVVTSYTGAVTLAIKPGTGAPNAVLGGTTTISAVSGTATFTDLVIDRIGAAYVLTASSGTLPAVDSSPFNVVQSRFVGSDVSRMLRWAGGMATPTATDVWNFDVEKAGASNGVIDILDAERVARKVTGFEPNP